MDSQENPEVKETPPQSISDAKARLIAEAGKVDFLAPLREHPWATVGSAAVLGAALGSVGELLRDRKRASQPEAGRKFDDDEAAATSTTHSILGLQTLLPLLQPLLMRGARFALDWWNTRQQAAVPAVPVEAAPVENQTHPSTETV